MIRKDEIKLNADEVTQRIHFKSTTEKRIELLIRPITFLNYFTGKNIILNDIEPYITGVEF